MSRGSTSLDNREYDQWLADNRRGKELRERKAERRSANKGYAGWHFGLGPRPVYTRDKEEFKKELEKRGLMMKDDVRKQPLNRDELMRRPDDERRRR